MTVLIDPVVGTGPTQLGMFNISVSPNSSTYKLIKTQFISKTQCTRLPS